jgi:hypothetical protein
VIAIWSNNKKDGKHRNAKDEKWMKNINTSKMDMLSIFEKLTFLGLFPSHF